MDRDKLKYWLYFYDIHEAEDLLENHYFYLILHEDYGTPIKARYHDDVPHFTFYTSEGPKTTYLFENKITHFAELLSKDEYLQCIRLCNKEDYEKQKPAEKTKAKGEEA